MAACDQLLVIRKNDLFSQITDQEFEDLNLIHRFKETPRNQFIYFESQLQNALFFLKEGFVKVGYFDKEGKEVIKEVIGPGDIFGKFTLLPQNREGEFAMAFKADVSLCMFSVEDFEKLLIAKPSISMKYHKQIGLKLMRLENRMINLLKRDVKERLLYFFYSLTFQFPECGNGESFSMENILTHDDVAKLIASSRQTVTSFLTQLEKEGIVAFTRQRILIPNVKELKKRLDVA
jgi:CRP/FNR family transcriptional regulator